MSADIQHAAGLVDITGNYGSQELFRKFLQDKYRRSENEITTVNLPVGYLEPDYTPGRNSSGDRDSVVVSPSISFPVHLSSFSLGPQPPPWSTNSLESYWLWYSSWDPTVVIFLLYLQN